MTKHLVRTNNLCLNRIINLVRKMHIWNRLCKMVKENIPLTLIIVAALMLELTTGVMYYSAQSIIHRTVEKLTLSQMNNIYLCIRNKLAKIEVTVDNISWVVNDGLDEPEWMYSITRRLVENNPSILGGTVSFVPNYFPVVGLCRAYADCYWRLWFL